jgi:hypothetical protein
MYGAGREVNEEWVAWWEESSEGSGLGGCDVAQVRFCKWLWGLATR